jgi:hypothetical protein
VSEQIARLQQRQLEMVQQTAQELESLKLQLEKSEHVEHLEAEVAKLRAERSELEHSLHSLQEQLVNQQEHTTTVVGGLTDVIRTHLKQVQGFASETEQYLTHLPAMAKVASQPVAAAPKPQPIAAPVFTPKPVYHQEKVAREPKPARTFSGRRFAVRALAFGLVVAAGYGGVQALKNRTSSDEGDVAGVSIITAETPTMQPYAESYAEVPFNQTIWERMTDAEFGVSFEYPKNTSNIAHTVGSNNLWMVRYNYYLLRTNKIETTLALDAWWIGNQENYAADSTVT